MMLNTLALDPGKLAFMERAEHELASFHHAVAELYGSAEAERAAEDWLHAFKTTTSESGTLPWRRIASSAATRLAARKAAEQGGTLGRMRQMLKRGGQTPCFCSCGAK